MIIVTTSDITGKTIKKTLGLARGNTIRARHIGHDIMASLKNLVGGEIEDYTKMMAEAREQAIDRMVGEAKELGANAIVICALPPARSCKMPRKLSLMVQL